ncbi:CinA family nicotinamide mononucleotide deamidase-related protein [Neiella marina]|uniref:CinA-like protein n=1 Tax=Neiella holothuriorum TaxID=2870530 RepID=A0ABS7ED30_9GAMM|nr:CinA family nicotinamide mononucleotide deamidase-related protein [Neiella holothuriorum]MBW8190216.1 CinA family nicotinamide mononucleotide deamidase-related protein [Neiella holothuriorum]
MKIALISTGEEILAGDIVDTNSAWLAEQLHEHGLKLAWHVTVGDDMASLLDAFSLAAERSDFCIVNGGLGPTTDDLSAEAAATWLGEGMRELPEWRDKLEQYYAKLNRVMPASNIKQAMIPESAQMIDNPVGTACGFAIQHDNCQLMFTPGVPHEFKRMIHDQVIPTLLQHAQQQAPSLHRWLTIGLSESLLADLLDDLPLPSGCTLGYRSSQPTIEVKLSVPSDVSEEQLSTVKQGINQRLGGYVFVDAKLSLAAHIQQLMLARGVKLATAESCTGGMIADWLVHEAGSSAYFERGYVTYSNEAKQQDLAVPETVLAQYGAVSAEVAAAMACGASVNANTDFALATSGIAGPSGDTPNKPVGTVAFALKTPTGVYQQLLKLPNRGRTMIRKQAAAIALDMLRRYLTGVDVLADYSGVSEMKQEFIAN